MSITPLTVTIDLNPSYKKIPAVYVSQLDNNLRELAITLQDGGVNYDVASSGYDVYIEGTKPDYKGFSYKVTDIGGTIVGSVITVPMQTQMTCVQGMVPTEIVLKSGADRIGSANFLLVVERAGLAEDVDVSETDIPAYIDGAQQAAAAAAQSADDAEDAKDLAVAAKDTAVSVAASIPADYTTLSNDVTDLKTATDILTLTTETRTGLYVDDSGKIGSRTSSQIILVDLTQITGTPTIEATITGTQNRCRLLLMTANIADVVSGTTGTYIDKGNTTTAFTLDHSVYGQYNTLAICTNFQSTPYATVKVITNAFAGLTLDVSDLEKVVDNNLPSKNLYYLSGFKESTTNGITFTNNLDGTVTASGTSTGNIYRPMGSVYLDAGEYILSGLSVPSSVALQVLNSDNTAFIATQNGGIETKFTLTEAQTCNVRLYVSAANVTLTNEVIKPMICHAEIADTEFTPYGNKQIALFIGDSYTQATSLGSNQYLRYSSLVCRAMGWHEKNYAVGGMGFVYGDTPYITQLQNAIADTSFNHFDVRHIVICGGINDLNASDIQTTLPSAVKNVIDTASTAFPNADIIVIPMTYYNVNLSQQGFYVYKTIANVCRENKCRLIPNAYTWLIGQKDMILIDGVHPTVDGHAMIASHIINALATGDSNPYPASCSYSAVASAIDTSANCYFCSMLTGTELSVNGTFTLTGDVSANTQLFSYESATSKNNPTYIGTYGKHIPCFNMSTGEAGILLIGQSDTTNGYINYVNAYTALNAGTWKVMSASIQFGVQEYAGNMN